MIVLWCLGIFIIFFFFFFFFFFFQQHLFADPALDIAQPRMSGERPDRTAVARDELLTDLRRGQSPSSRSTSTSAVASTPRRRRDMPDTPAIS